MIVMELWNWDEAVAVLAPAEALTPELLKDVCPGGFMLADQQLERALFVDIDDVDGIQIARVPRWRNWTT